MDIHYATQILIISDKLGNVIYKNKIGDYFLKNNKTIDSFFFEKKLFLEALPKYFLTEFELDTPLIKKIFINWEKVKVEAERYLFLGIPVDSDIHLNQIHQEILDAIPVPVFWKNLNHHIMGCNRQYANNAGFSEANDLIGKTDAELPWRKFADKYICDDEQVVQSQCSLFFEEENISQDGDPSYVMVTKSPLYDRQNKVVGIIGSYIDVTDKKKAQQLALEKAEAEKRALTKITEERTRAAKKERDIRDSVTIFSGMMAHDQRNHLTVLSWASSNFKNRMERLIEASQDAIEKQPSMTSVAMEMQSALQEFEEKIHGTLGDMNDLITQSLRSLKHSLKEKLGQEDLEPCHLFKCLNEVVMRYPYQEKERSLVTLDLESQDFLFLGNPILFGSILSNLLKNALEQIREKKQGEIFLSSRVTEEMNYLVIKDTAGGASPDVMKKLFQGYVSTKEGGTGVGLASCKAMMRIFGGDITALSVYGESMEFVLSFPILSASDKVTDLS